MNLILAKITFLENKRKREINSPTPSPNERKIVLRKGDNDTIFLDPTYQPSNDLMLATTLNTSNNLPEALFRFELLTECKKKPKPFFSHSESSKEPFRLGRVDFK